MGIIENERMHSAIHQTDRQTDRQKDRKTDTHTHRASLVPDLGGQV